MKFIVQLSMVLSTALFAACGGSGVSDASAPLTGSAPDSIKAEVDKEALLLNEAYEKQFAQMAIIKQSEQNDEIQIKSVPLATSKFAESSSGIVVEPPVKPVQPLIPINNATSIPASWYSLTDQRNDGYKVCSNVAVRSIGIDQVSTNNSQSGMSAGLTERLGIRNQMLASLALEKIDIARGDTRLSAMAAGAGHSMIAVAEYATAKAAGIDVLNHYVNATTNDKFTPIANSTDEKMGEAYLFQGSGYAAFYYMYGCHLTAKNQKRILRILSGKSYGWNGDKTDSDPTNNAPSFNTSNLALEASVVSWFMVRLMSLEGQSVPWQSGNHFTYHNIFKVGGNNSPSENDLSPTTMVKRSRNADGTVKNRQQDFETIILDTVVKYYGGVHSEWNSQPYGGAHIAVLPVIAALHSDPDIAVYAKKALDATIARYAGVWLQNQRLTAGGRDYANYQNGIPDGVSQALYPWFGPNVAGVMPLGPHKTPLCSVNCSNRWLRGFTTMVLGYVPPPAVTELARKGNAAWAAGMPEEDFGWMKTGYSAEGRDIYFYRNLKNYWGVYSGFGTGVDTNIGTQNAATGVVWRNSDPAIEGGHFVWGSPHDRYAVQSFNDTINPAKAGPARNGFPSALAYSFGTEGPGNHLDGQQWYQSGSTTLHVGNASMHNNYLASAVSLGSWTSNATVKTQYASRQLNGAYRLLIGGNDQPFIVVSSLRIIQLHELSRLMGINADATGQFGMAVEAIDRSELAGETTEAKFANLEQLIKTNPSRFALTQVTQPISITRKAVNTGNNTLDLNNLFRGKVLSNLTDMQGSALVPSCAPPNQCGVSTFRYFLRATDGTQAPGYVINSNVALNRAKTDNLIPFNKGGNSLSFNDSGNGANIELLAIIASEDSAEDRLSDEQWSAVKTAYNGAAAGILPRGMVSLPVKIITLPAVVNNRAQRLITETRMTTALKYVNFKNTSLEKVFVPSPTPKAFVPYTWGEKLNGELVVRDSMAYNSPDIKQTAFLCPLSVKTASGWEVVGGHDGSIAFNNLMFKSGYYADLMGYLGSDIPSCMPR
jgi:hypothetical protein